MRYLVLNAEGFVVNTVIWDGVSKVRWGDKTTMLESDAPNMVTFGWRYLNGEWIEPPKPIVEEIEETTETEV